VKHPRITAPEAPVDLGTVSDRKAFAVEADAAARAWLDSHPCANSRRLDYEVTLCCGGGRIRRVNLHSPKVAEDPGDGVAAPLGDDGTVLLIDRRAAARLPSRFGLTVRGFGPFRRLDLDMSPEQWGVLLYD
jgi:hypothetical protein